MDRREFFQTSIIATLAGKVLSDVDARSRRRRLPPLRRQTPAAPARRRTARRRRAG